MSLATKTPQADPTEVRMTFEEHLEELRWKLVKSLVALLATFVLATIFYQELVWFVVQPHFQVMEWLKIRDSNAQLIAGAYTKPIWAVMKLSLIVGLFAASPY